MQTQKTENKTTITYKETDCLTISGGSRSLKLLLPTYLNEEKVH